MFSTESTTSTPRSRTSSSGSSSSNSPLSISTSTSFSSTPTLLSPEPSSSTRFRLSSAFIDKYRNIPPPFGYNGLGELVYRRTYSRKKEDGTNEQWFETVERVVNGTYNMQKTWIEQHSLGWNAWQAQRSAQEMFKRIFEMKFLPPGRGLWAMGSPITEQRGLYAALNNCAFVSTETMRDDGPAKPFCFLMDASMLGVGVGFDTKGAGTFVIKGPNTSRTVEPFVIPDSREGWVQALRLQLEAYFDYKPLPTFDYSQIRLAGTPIRGFGGVASGPGALQDLLHSVKTTLDREINHPISVTTIVDLMNHIGKCVIAGNVRRTAEIAFGPANLPEYLDLKNYGKNPDRAAFGWTSNNSIFADLGMDYKPVVERVISNGEPGFAWLDNMKEYSRISGDPDHRDHRARGGNPCLEQTLESYELCCLVETFPAKHESLDDFQRTLKYAYLYAKTVTLGKTQWPETNRVMLRNRRIGCSVSGIAQFITKHNLHELKHWLTSGYNTIQSYDQLYSDWLCVPRSIKTTSVKPSGTVSLLAGATPGMHYPESRFYLRRVRLSNTSDLLPALRDAGFHIEDAVDGPGTTVVVEIPIDVGKGVRTSREVSMWEQLSLAAFLQRYWADNQVSCTVTFDPITEGPQLSYALDYFQYQLKGISFLPRMPSGAYAQMPYEEITEQQYHDKVKHIKPLTFKKEDREDAVPDRFCDGDVCGIVPDNKVTNGTTLPGQSQLETPILTNLDAPTPSSQTKSSTHS